MVGGSPASSTTKTDHHDIAEILLKVALKIIKSNQSKITKYIITGEVTMSYIIDIFFSIV
jgi:hypothetical protein